jgi:NitT/TauT family transport system substrate-binding protein
MAAERIVARCASGYPEARPLPAPATLRVGVRAVTEDLAPLLLADELDVFAEENLTVEIVEIAGQAELFTALERGDVDAVAGDLDAAFFDLASSGSGARVVVGGAVAAASGDLATDQVGLWVRNDRLPPQPGQWFALRGHRIALPDGIGDVATYPTAALLGQDDLTLNDVQLIGAGGAAAAEALIAGSVAGAWLPEPDWRTVADRGGINLVATLPAESLGGVVLPEHLLDRARDREVGLAFVRAIIRTINTYLFDDYQSDDEVVAALATATGLDEEQIGATPEWIFDWELRRGTTQRIQTPLLDLGAVVYEEELPESQLVDRSLYHDVLQ